MKTPQLRALISALGLIAALAIAIAVPAAYCLLGLTDSAESLDFKARLSARRTAQFIFTQDGLEDGLWKYQMARLSEVIAFPDGSGAPMRQSITDSSGILILQESDDPPAPVQRVRLPIVVGGETVAWLEAEVSLRALIINTALVAAVSCLLGVLTWLMVRQLALRALDRTLSQLAMESTRFRAALNNMSQGLCLFDARDRLVVHNHRFVTMFGTPTLGATATDIMPSPDMRVLFTPPGTATEDSSDEQSQDLDDGRTIQVVRRIIAQGGWVATYEDITERRHTQNQLSHMARHDALTSLPNRVMLREHMQHVLTRLRQGGSVAVLCLDLDGFKLVNDTLGHPAGDDLLCQVGQRLRQVVRKTDLVARLGGDEFAVIQVDASQPAQVMALADRLIEAVAAPFIVHGHRVEIATSIGAVIASGSSLSSDDLMRNADIALYRAKAEGRGICRFFQPGMDDQIQQRRRVVDDLKQALAEQQFEVFYQPLIGARGQMLTGFEALIRWHHPTRGLVPPADFIPIAEETGLIKAIGAWVLSRACADAARWPAFVKVAVNLSPLQFADQNLTEQVEQALTDAGLAPHRLELEITESVLLRDTDATFSILRRMHEMGVSISMDDFGTGYSSLSYLRRFPFDKIKIDRSFVHNLHSGKGSVEIVRAVIGLGKALGMSILAEGVETTQQLTILTDEGCDELQGYLFSKPRPVSDVPNMILAFSGEARVDAAD